MAFNKVILVGNLVSDPELKATTNDVNVTRFRIAVGRRFAKADAEVKADFFDIVAWRNTAEFVCKHFTKGKPILVSGSIQNRTWTDTEGNKHWATEIVADEVSFVGSKGDNGQATANEAPSYGIPDGLEELADEDSLPFD
jgi:single-strand DNA-binding protein